MYFSFEQGKAICEMFFQKWTIWREDRCLVRKKRRMGIIRREERVRE